ncbi:flagellar hook capping FlgD N-terminal domain-containing protein, partial [Desulfofalx alkaliphila]|uniref:flagellar hook capping FlgD N-terminal domain-containing protein n=1 Tax=Desulfofalx alkaliphila TaxID=105483 RepID=UPI0004E13C69
MEVKATNSDLYWKDKPREPKQILDKDAFLLIMIEQLKNQDPTSPMDSDKFISQMAQFTTLEQMTNLNSQFADMGEKIADMGAHLASLAHMQQLNQGSLLIGYQVSLMDGGNEVRGIVEKALMSDQGVQVVIAGRAYDINKIRSVEAPIWEPEQGGEEEGE